MTTKKGDLLVLASGGGQVLGTGRGCPAPRTLPCPQGLTMGSFHQQRYRHRASSAGAPEGRCWTPAGDGPWRGLGGGGGDEAWQLVRAGAREQKPLPAAPLIAPWNLDTRAQASPRGPSPRVHTFAGLLDCSPWTLVPWEPTHLPAQGLPTAP